MARQDGFDLDLETEAFRKWTRDFADEVEVENETALKKMAFDFLERVIKKTPVDTGRARGGWTSYLVGKGGSDIAKSAVRSPDPGGGGSSPKSSEVARGREDSDFDEGRVPLKGPFIVLTNGVEYITFLEFGSSDQAPAGMVRLTFREMRLGRELTEPMRDSLRNALKSANRRVRGAGVRTLPG